jgi:TatD DNase family protein
MIPYINIHTHHLPKEDGVFLFNNRFGSQEAVYTGQYFSAGIHPWDANKEIILSELEQIIAHKHCLAVGECGLDKVKGPGLPVQKALFEAQLKLALKHQKPVIIHCVKAFDELMEICGPFQSKIPLVIHGFHKSAQLAQQLIHKGFYLSLNHSVFKKEEPEFKKIPVDRIFLETDDYEELSIATVYRQAAYYFNRTEDELKEKIYSNFTTLFKSYGR